MVFRNSNTKKKYTKRHTKAKRKYTNRKSKKYGGKCSDIKHLDIVRTYLLMVRIPPNKVNSLVNNILDSEYKYNCDKILDRLRNDIYKAQLKHGLKINDIEGTQKVIFASLIELENEAKKRSKSIPQEPKSIPQEPVETQEPVSNDGCRSRDREPVNCNERNDYLKQTLIFHPDKNPMCIEDATLKFQALQNNTTCKFD
jgi:hypothetical protein